MLVEPYKALRYFSFAPHCQRIAFLSHKTMLSNETLECQTASKRRERLGLGCPYEPDFGRHAAVEHFVGIKPKSINAVTVEMISLIVTVIIVWFIWRHAAYIKRKWSKLAKQESGYDVIL